MDLQQMEQLKQAEEMKRKLLAQVLTKEAWERLARVRAVNPNLAGQVELYLIQALQSGGIKEKLTDGKMKEVLKALSEKKDVKIKRI